MQTGEDFAIFQDRNDITWGQHWEERINKSLADVTFLVPIITPSFFKSPSCRSEFMTFALKEKVLGVNRLIMPLYYVTCDQLGEAYHSGSDEIVDIVRKRNWTDWRQFRFKQFTDEKVAAAVAELATAIKASISELNSINILAASKPIEVTPTPKGLPEILPETDIPPSGELYTLDADASESEKNYEVSELAANAPRDLHGDEDVRSHPYYVFTRLFDETIEAGDLVNRNELTKLHKYVGSFARALKKINEPALSSFLSQFRAKTEIPSLAVTLLIDNSGSMRGPKIIHTAAWCIIISEWMDRLRIPLEVLGFTTRAWKGGQSREAWLAAGKPPNPGRLNDLRHLIFKGTSIYSDFEYRAVSAGAARSAFLMGSAA